MTTNQQIPAASDTAVWSSSFLGFCEHSKTPAIRGKKTGLEYCLTSEEMKLAYQMGFTSLRSVCHSNERADRKQIRCMLKAAQFLLRLFRGGYIPAVTNILQHCDWKRVAQVSIACQNSGIFESIIRSKKSLHQICVLNTDAEYWANLQVFDGLHINKPFDLDLISNLGTAQEFWSEHERLYKSSETFMLDSLPLPALINESNENPDPEYVAFNESYNFVVILHSKLVLGVYRFSAQTSVRSNYGPIALLFTPTFFEGVVSNVSWSPDGLTLMVELSRDRNFPYNSLGLHPTRQLIFFRLYPKKGIVRKIANMEAIHICTGHNSRHLWILESTLLISCPCKNNGPLRTLNFNEDRIIDREFLTTKERLTQVLFKVTNPANANPSNSNQTEELIIRYLEDSPIRAASGYHCYLGFFFAAPDNHQHLFFVANCWHAHNHQRVYILDRVTKQLTGFLSLPGNLRSVATHKSKIFLLVCEPGGAEWSSDGSVTYSSIDKFADCSLTLSATSPTAATPHHGIRLRLASFDGTRVVNLLDNSFPPVSAQDAAVPIIIDNLRPSISFYLATIDSRFYSYLTADDRFVYIHNLEAVETISVGHRHSFLKYSANFVPPQHPTRRIAFSHPSKSIFLSRGQYALHKFYNIYLSDWTLPEQRQQLTAITAPEFTKAKKIKHDIIY